MTDVNPPPVKIPNKLLNDPELRSFFEQLLFSIMQLWVRTGAGTDLIDKATVGNVINNTSLAIAISSGEEVENELIVTRSNDDELQHLQRQLSAVRDGDSQGQMDELEHLQRQVAALFNSDVRDQIDDLEKLMWL